MQVVVTLVCVQVALHCVGALAGGIMFYRWWRLDKDSKDRIWRLYGWLSGLMAFGSCVGVIGWVARMLQLYNNVVASDMLSSPSFRGVDLYFAESARWNAVFAVMHAVEFLCLSSAKVMVLDRMSDFGAPKVDGVRRWARYGWFVMTAVVLGNLAGLAASVAAADYYRRSSESSFAAYSFSVANDTITARSQASLAKTLNDDAQSVYSVQSFCEFSVLLLIVFAFAVVGVLCLRRINDIASLLRSTQSRTSSFAAAEGSHLRKQILYTTLFVFVAFLLRSIQASIDTLALKLSDSHLPCRPNNEINRLGLCNPSCYNMWTHMLRWNQRTPEFETVVIMISSPLAILVALWGMSSRNVLKLMNGEQKLRGTETSGL
jgi:hypothetical protein